MSMSTADSNRDLMASPKFSMVAEQDAATEASAGDLLEIRINGVVVKEFRLFKPMFIDRIKLYDITNDKGFRRGIGLHFGRKKVY